MAGLTGLEPATSDVTGRRSNQLNYNPALAEPAGSVARQPLSLGCPKPERPVAEPDWCPGWWAVQDSNL